MALAELSEHFQAGRLTHEEFDERSDRALKARTGNDLRELFADLPAPGASLTGPDADAAAGDSAARPEPAPSRPVARGVHLPVGRIVIACVIASIIIGNVTANVGHGAHHVNFGWLVPVIILLVVLRRIHR